MIKHKEWIAALLGGGLVVYGVGGYITSNAANAEMNLVWWAQVAGLVVVGCVLGGWGINRLDRGGISPTPIAVINTPESRVRPVISHDGVIDKQEQKDNEALHHISSRMRVNPQGLSLCRQLHDCLFELHHGAIVVEEGHSVSFKSSLESNDEGTRLHRSKMVAEPSDDVDPRGVL